MNINAMTNYELIQQKEQSRRRSGAIVFPAVLPVKQKSAQAPVLGTPEQIFSLFVIHCI